MNLLLSASPNVTVSGDNFTVPSVIACCNVVATSVRLNTLVTSANGIHYSGTAVGTATSNSSTTDTNTITDTSAYEFTISASTTVSGAVNIKRPDGNYIGNPNSKNTARLYTAVSASTAYGVTIGANDVVTLSCAAATGYPTLQYNTGSPRFANYNKTQKNLVLYKLQ